MPFTLLAVESVVVRGKVRKSKSFQYKFLDWRMIPLVDMVKQRIAIHKHRKPWLETIIEKKDVKG